MVYPSTTYIEVEYSSMTFAIRTYVEVEYFSTTYVEVEYSSMTFAIRTYVVCSR